MPSGDPYLPHNHSGEDIDSTQESNAQRVGLYDLVMDTQLGTDTLMAEAIGEYEPTQTFSVPNLTHPGYDPVRLSSSSPVTCLTRVDIASFSCS